MSDIVNKLKSNLTDMDNMPRMMSEMCTNVRDTERAIEEIERLRTALTFADEQARKIEDLAWHLLETYGEIKDIV